MSDVHEIIDAKELGRRLRRRIMNGATTESEWLTAGEAASYLKIEPRTLLLWARQGRVKGFVLSGTQRITWRFRAADLDATLVPPSVALTNRRIR